MQSYMVIENITIKTENKKLRKDMIFSSDDMCSRDITRFLKKGYIKRIGNVSDDADGINSEPPEKKLPFYLATEDYLSEDELKLLNKKELKEYADHIKVPNITVRMNASQLATSINTFIEASIGNDEEIEGDEEDQDSEGDPQ